MPLHFSFSDCFNRQTFPLAFSLYGIAGGDRQIFAPVPFFILGQIAVVEAICMCPSLQIFWHATLMTKGFALYIDPLRLFGWVGALSERHM